VAVTETVGGALLIAALATPLVAAALAIDMLVALLTARPGHGVFDRDGGFELLLGGASVAIGIVGGGPAPAHARRRIPREGVSTSTRRFSCLAASCSERAV
jgi:putative oxidoreductase